VLDQIRGRLCGVTPTAAGSQTDGPHVVHAGVHEGAAADYKARFLHAQALGTIFAMRDAGRPVLLATVRREDAAAALTELLDEAAAQLSPSA